MSKQSDESKASKATLDEIQKATEFTTATVETKDVLKDKPYADLQADLEGLRFQLSRTETEIAVARNNQIEARRALKDPDAKTSFDAEIDSKKAEYKRLKASIDTLEGQPEPHVGPPAAVLKVERDFATNVKTV